MPKTVERVDNSVTAVRERLSRTFGLVESEYLDKELAVADYLNKVGLKGLRFDQDLAKKKIEELNVVMDTLPRLVPPDLLPRVERRVKVTRSALKMVLTLLRNGRIHTAFQHAVCNSGRIYTKNYNLQSLPVQGRACVLPDEGYEFANADYKSMELRILFNLSGEAPTVLKSMAQYPDTLKWIASQVNEVPYNLVSRHMRSEIKVFVYAICYGSDVAGTDEQMAKFWKLFPNLKKWISDVKREALLKGYTYTKFGWIRNLREDIIQDRNEARRKAINTMIQGTSAAYLKLAIYNLFKAGFDVRMCVHDSCLIQLPIVRRVEEDRIKEAMEFHEEGKLPLEVEIHLGSTWAEAAHPNFDEIWKERLTGIDFKED